MTAAELEREMQDVWHRFVSACATKDKSATALWRKLKHLRDQRTAEQTALALFRAGLNPDGSRIEKGAAR